METPAPVLKICSFCNKSQREVAIMIAGPGVNICNECIDLCNDIIAEDRAKKLGPVRINPEIRGSVCAAREVTARTSAAHSAVNLRRTCGS